MINRFERWEAIALVGQFLAVLLLFDAPGWRSAFAGYIVLASICLTVVGHYSKGNRRAKRNGSTDHSTVRHS